MDWLLIGTVATFGSLAIVLLRMGRHAWVALGETETELGRAAEIDSNGTTADVD